MNKEDIQNYYLDKQKIKKVLKDIREMATSDNLTIDMILKVLDLDDDVE